MTAASVLADLGKALKKFGTYNYYDKGVDEVFAASPVVAHLRQLSAEEAVRFLVSISKHEHGKHLVSHLVNCMDTAEESWFEQVVEGCRVADLDVY